MEKQAVEELLEKQRKWCFKDFLQIDVYQTDRAKFYKNVLGAVFSVIGICIIIFSGVVAWSYKPIQDIATLKAEVRLMNDNLNKLLRQNGQRAREEIMDFSSTCLECGYKISIKIDKGKRQCYKCATVYNVRELEKVERIDPGKEASRQVAILKNPVIDAR